MKKGSYCSYCFYVSKHRHLITKYYWKEYGKFYKIFCGFRVFIPRYRTKNENGGIGAKSARHVVIRVFVFTYRAITENAELAEIKIGVIFDWENPWKGMRVSWEIILKLFYMWRKVIIIFRGFWRFRESRGINLVQSREQGSNSNKYLKLTISDV